MAVPFVHMARQRAARWSSSVVLRLLRRGVQSCNCDRYLERPLEPTACCSCSHRPPPTLTVQQQRQQQLQQQLLLRLLLRGYQ